MPSAAEIARALGRPQKTATGWLAPCPCASHGKGRGDRNPSQHLSDGPDGLLWHCKTGCDQDQVRAALEGKGSLDWAKSNGADGRARALQPTAARMRELEADVLMIDGVTDTFAGNENDRGQVKSFLNALVSLIHEDTGAVLLIAHVNRLTASSSATFEGYSGTTGWHNGVRARWYGRSETRQDEEDEQPKKTGALELALQKNNLGRGDRSIAFRWSEDAHLFVGEQPATGFRRDPEQARRAPIHPRRDARMPGARRVRLGRNDRAPDGSPRPASH